MTEVEACEILLGYDHEPHRKRWDALVARSDMRVAYVGVCPDCQTSTQYEFRLPAVVRESLPDCATCRSLADEFEALTRESDERMNRFNAASEAPR